jgi:hypothetical protein
MHDCVQKKIPIGKFGSSEELTQLIKEEVIRVSQTG